MTRRSKTIWMLAAGCAAAAVLATAALAASASQPMASAGSGKAMWSDTTTKAATTPEQKAVLDGGKPATVSGELVEVSCYLQLGKRGEKHIPCGSDCLKHGQPAGIVDKDGKLTVLFVEAHDPRRNGEVDMRDTFVSLLSKQVTATGMLTKSKDGVQSLFIEPGSLKAQ
jgi:hypothetical protein